MRLSEQRTGLLARDIGYFYEGEDVVLTIRLRAPDGSLVDADEVLVTIVGSSGSAVVEGYAVRAQPGVFVYTHDGAALAAGRYRVQAKVKRAGMTQMTDIYEFTVRAALTGM
jgi:hypothetical protein